MSRTRFVHRPNHPLASANGFVSLDDLALDDLPIVDQKVEVFGEAHYDGMRAVDGTPIDSKRKRREYMNARGLADYGDFAGTRAKAEKMRQELSTTGGDHKERREQIERAIYDLENKKVKPQRAKNMSAGERETLSRIAKEVGEGLKR